MRFGITPREWGDFFEEAHSQIRAAEMADFDSVWFEEHHEHEEYLPSPLSALMVVSMHTKMKLGTNVLILPTYQLVRLAEDIAMLDRISHGRVILGVGSGYREKDFRNSGFGLKDRAVYMDEGIPLLRRLLREAHVTHSGPMFKTEDATIEPRPFQKDGPPVWVGGWKDVAVRRAARVGDAWFPGPTAALKDVLACKSVYEAEMGRLGRQTRPLPIMREVYVAETTDLALEEARDSFIHTYQADYSSSEHPLLHGLKLEFAEWARDRFIIGGPDTVANEIERYRKAGFDYIVFRVALRRLENDKILSSIRLLGERVLPHFRDRG